MTALRCAGRVLLTRSGEDAARLVARLAARGVHADTLPLIERCRVSWALPPEARAITWVILTSKAAAVELAPLKPLCGTARLAVVGPGTAAAARAAGWEPDFIGDGRGAESLSIAMAVKQVLDGAQCLWLRGAEALPHVRDLLTAHGAVLHEVIVYRTTKLVPEPWRLRAALQDVNVTVLASPSAVKALAEGLAAAGLETTAAGTCIATGRSTHEALAALGFRRTASADAATDEALEHAIMLALGDGHE